MKKERYFAGIGEDNLVSMVIVGDSLESVKENFPGNWVETYTDREDKVYASQGFLYVEDDDNFIPPEEDGFVGSLEVMPSLEQIAEWGYPPPFEHLNPENQ